MTGAVSIVVEQTLHGYRDGHELLASSLPLPTAARRRMLVQSDFSGDEPTRGFYHYLSGYPLSDVPYYALSKTWYAKEMRRPGCVWTHTILLRHSDLDRVESFQNLLSSFRRPTDAQQTRSFKQSIAVDVSSADECSADSDELAFAAEVLEAIYDGRYRSVLLAAASSQEFEELALRIWRQQWPNLRENFAFSTGSLALRMLDRRLFDLQVIPEHRWRQMAQRETSVIGLYRAHEQTSELKKKDLTFGTLRPLSVHQQWPQLAAADLFSEENPFRTFMHQFCHDVPPSKQAFSGLARTFVTCQRVRRRQSTVSSALEMVTTAFPNEQALALKKALVGVSDSTATKPLADEVSPGDSLGNAMLIDNLLAGIPLEERIKAALTIDDFNLPGLSFTAQEFFGIDSTLKINQIGWLFQGKALNNVGLSVRQNLTESFSSDDLVQLANHDRALCSIVIEHAPRHLYSRLLWSQPREFQRICLQAARAADDVDRTKVMHAMVAAPEFALSRELIEWLGPEALGPLLTMLNEALFDHGDISLKAWFAAFRSARQEVLHWLQPHHDRIHGRLLCALAFCDSKAVLNTVSPDAVAAAVDEADGGGYRVAASACVALALAFRTRQPAGGRIASACFETAHAAAIAPRLPWQAWRLLEPLLPSGGFWGLWDWDHAEKLRRAYVDAFVQHRSWPRNLMIAGLTNPDTRRRVRRYCETSEEGRRLAAFTSR